MVFVDFYFVNKFNVKLWNIFFVRRSYLYKNINYIYFICYIIICSWFNYNEYLFIDKYFEKKIGIWVYKNKLY